MLDRLSIFSRRLFTSVYEFDYTNASSFGFIKNRDKTLRHSFDTSRGGNKTDLYLELLGDPYVLQCYTRLSETINKSVLSVEGDYEDLVRNMIDSGLFQQITDNLLIAHITGIAAVELIPSIINGYFSYESAVSVDTNRIVYKLVEGLEEPRILTKPNNINGDPLPPNRIVIHKHYAVPVYNIYGFGIGSSLKQLLDLKEFCLKQWSDIAQKFSRPSIAASIPEVASEEEVTAFLSDLKAMCQESVFVLPPDFSISTIDRGNIDSVSSLILPLLDYVDNAIAGLMIGEDLSGATVSQGSYDRSPIDISTAENKALLISQRIDSTITNTVIKWIWAINKIPGKLPVITRTYPNSNVNTTLSQNLLSMFQLGLTPDPEFVSKAFGIPLAKQSQTSIDPFAPTTDGAVQDTDTLEPSVDSEEISEG